MASAYDAADAIRRLLDDDHPACAWRPRRRFGARRVPSSAYWSFTSSPPMTTTSRRPATRLRLPAFGGMTAKLRQDAALVKLLRNAVQGAADDEGWALVGTVGTHIANQSSFDF